MTEITIKGGELESRAQLHALLRERLAPLLEKYDIEYIGSNLDALHDVLTSIRGEDVLLRFEALEDARASLGSYLGGLRHVLEDAAEENEHVRVEIGN